MPGSTAQFDPPIGPDREERGQYFTPAWAAELLYDAHFSHLGATDLVWEPTCGPGNMVSAVPAHVPCIASEIDPALAALAARKTKRQVLLGDCRTVALPSGISAVFGNPPFELALFEELLERCAGILKNGQKAGFTLPAYFVQTSRTVMSLAKVWSIEQEILPRDLFPGLSKPLIFGLFTRDFSPRLVGFRLFPEMAAMRELPEGRQDLFANAVDGPRSVWLTSVKSIVAELGGRASLDQIYRAIEGRRPTENPHWKQQIRKVIREHDSVFACVERGVYQVQAA